MESNIDRNMLTAPSMDSVSSVCSVGEIFCQLSRKKAKLFFLLAQDMELRQSC